MRLPFLLLVNLTLFLTSCVNTQILGFSSRTINPLQYGLNEAKTGVERFSVLKRTHEEARRLGVGVSYAGIKRIDLEIPPKATSIPLTIYTDFAGVTLQVENHQKDVFLFSLADDLTSVSVTGKEIDSQDFSHNPILKAGCKLLVITDKTSWVENRIGYDYGATRKDIMLVKNGRSGNGPVQSCSTPQSQPDGGYCDVDETVKKTVKNLTFNRTNGSTKKTQLVLIENQYNVELTNITINTPVGSGLYGDRAIRLINCMNVSMTGITINGTYSLPNKYGYGIAMNNTYDVSFHDVYARGNWGVFGNNNIHKAFLKDCDINRFDIHCYGKDISFEDCNFVNLYNQFSSVYGLISFKNCTFTNFTPILMGHSYNAYTAYEVRFENCTFNLDKKHYSIISFSGFTTDENKRPELKEKCLPNVILLDCKVNITDGVNKWYVYNTSNTKDYEGRFGHISNVEVEGLSVSSKSAKMEVFSKKIKTSKDVQLKIESNLK